MKNFLIAGVVALALVAFSAESSKCHAAGGGGWSVGLRLSGDANWWGWRSCNSCQNGGGNAGPAMWPMAGPMMAPMGGPQMAPMGWGYMPAPAPMPFAMPGPMYPPMPMHGGYPMPFGY